MTFNNDNDDKLSEIFSNVNLTHKIIFKKDNINIIKNILNNAKINIHNAKIRNKIIKKIDKNN